MVGKHTVYVRIALPVSLLGSFSLPLSLSLVESSASCMGSLSPSTSSLVSSEEGGKKVNEECASDGSKE